MQKKKKKCQKIYNANNINIFYEFLIKFSCFAFFGFFNSFLGVKIWLFLYLFT